MKVYLARQPIFTRDKRIYAYELLFRGGMENFFPNIDGDSATSRVLSSTFFSADFQQIAGEKRTFINFTKGLISRRIPLIFPRQITTVEILENIVPDGQFMECCRELSREGYQLALDDFEYREDLAELIGLAHIIKVDFLSTPEDRIVQYVKRFANVGCSFLAEKVETNEQFRWACDLGFSYFQGYFFSKPEVLGGTDIPSLKMNLLQIMSEAGKEGFSVDELDRLVERDVGVSYKLLRYLNSPFFRRNTDINSIKHAIMLLGEKGVKSFLSVIIMAELSQDKPDELLRSSVMRARLCEKLGHLSGTGADPSLLFTLGLFSLIDAILDSPMEQVMKKLPLAGEIKRTLLGEKTRFSEYLTLAEKYERGDWDGVLSQASTMKLDLDKLPELYMDALGFADALIETARV
jgi:c-di-GMP-related signal transduction protein